MEFVDLGKISFKEAYELQCRTVEEIASGRCDERIYFLEHPHTFTLGRRADERNLLRPLDCEENSIELIRINRGGDITYHGPGQIVGYPHLDLNHRGKDLHQYLRNLEECIMLTARLLGVRCFRRDGLTGVWTDQGKLASIGVGVRRWITMHGFALNVSTDLRYFSFINPCGMPDCPVTSLELLCEKEVPLEQLKAHLGNSFRKVFGKKPQSPE